MTFPLTATVYYYRTVVHSSPNSPSPIPTPVREQAPGPRQRRTPPMPPAVVAIAARQIVGGTLSLPASRSADLEAATAVLASPLRSAARRRPTAPTRQHQCNRWFASRILQPRVGFL